MRSSKASCWTAVLLICSLKASCHAVELEAVQCMEGGLDKYGSSSPSVIDGVAVWVVERKYSAPRTLPCEREAVGAALSAPPGKRSGC